MEFPMRTVSFLERHDRKLLSLEDRQYLSQVYENTSTASDDFLLGCIQAAAEKNGLSFEQAVDVFDRIVAWYNYVNIDGDELAQMIGGDILRLLRESEQELKEEATTLRCVFGMFGICVVLFVVWFIRVVIG